MSATLRELNRQESMARLGVIRCHRENGEIGSILKNVVPLLEAAGFSPREVLAVCLALQEAEIHAFRQGLHGISATRSIARPRIFLKGVKKPGPLRESISCLPPCKR
jgi:hypothetical protein